MLLNSLKIKLHHISKLMRSKATNKASQSQDIQDIKTSHGDILITFIACKLQD